jgi:urea carboxylase-associated protein 2
MKNFHSPSTPAEPPVSDPIDAPDQWRRFAPDLDESKLLFSERVHGGGHWSGVLRRGTALRLVDVEGGVNVAALFYNQDEKLERYNMADTLKAQHTAHLTRGFVCYSDMGRVLCSIVADTVGWHDPIGGVSGNADVVAKYGEHRFQEYRNDMTRSGREGLLIELGKWGLGARDLVANVNFFSKLTVDEAGAMHFQPANSRAGDYVDLRFEMNTLVALSTAPHPLDPRPQYAPGPLQLIAWRSDPPGADDYCRNFRPENRRGFYNTEILFR